MKMWLLLLCAVILTSLAIWGCITLVETPAQEQVTSELPSHAFTAYN